MDVVVGIFKQLGVNQSLFYMFALFVATYLVVSQLALKKLCAYLVEREHRLAGRVGQAGQLKDEYNKAQERLNRERQLAYVAAANAFNEIKAKSSEEQRTILNEARQESTQIIQDVRNEVATKIGQEMTKLENEIPVLAREMIEQILKGGVRAKLDHTLSSQN